MKTKTIYLLFFLAFSSALISAQENNQNATISSEKISAVITIEGMACQEGCADAIAKSLLETEGIDSAKVSYETKEALVQFDNSLVTINGLKKVITDTRVKDYVYVVKELVIKNETIK